MTTFRIFLSLSVCISWMAQTHAQTYKQMMYDPAYNFYEVVDSAEAYFSSHPKGKGSGFKDYMRWKVQNESRYYPSGERSGVDPYFAINQYERFRHDRTALSKGSFDLGWVDLGPYRADNITSHYSAGIGRVECFWVDPQNTDLIYMGSRSGGFWRTDDEGQTWQNTTDTLVASGVNTMAVKPGQADSLLINVRNANNGVSHGIYRSMDGGMHWTITAFNPANTNLGGWGSGFQVHKLVYHPRVKDLVFLGTTNGLYRSSNDLGSWTRIMSGDIRDIEFHPTKDSVIYLFNNSARGWIYRSTDLGNNFQQAGSMANNNAKGFLAVTPQNPDLVFLASSKGLYRSRNEGTSFQLISEPDEACEGFAVSDVDSNAMLFGYVDIEASEDGGEIFQQVTFWSQPFSSSYVHADVRTLECLNGTFYVGTDGYFCKSTDNGTTWTKLNVGTGIRENYRMGVSQSNWRLSMSGSQDNGTSILDTAGWIEWNGGDGMEAIVHPLNEAMMVGSWQYGTRNRTTDRGQSRHGIGTPESGSSQAYWIAPLLLDPLDHMQFYHFSSNIHRADEFGNSWTTVGSPGIGIIRVAAIAQNNPDIMLVSVGRYIRLTTDGGGSFTIIDNPQLNDALTYAVFDPNDDSTILITYNRYRDNGKKVYITHDLGQNWEDITYNLGSMPLLCATIDHSDSSYLYVGAEVGIFYKSMQGTEWFPYNENLPNVSVAELEIHYGSNTLKAATWGRGIWENSLVGRNEYPSIVETHLSEPPTENTPFLGMDLYVDARIQYDQDLSAVYLLYGVDSPKLQSRMELSHMGGDRWKTDDPFPVLHGNAKVYYKVYAVGQHADTSETYRFMFTLQPIDFCDARGDAGTGGDYIVGVQIGDVDFPSAKEFYLDMTEFPILANGEDSLSLKVSLNWSFPPDSVGAWLDANANSLFEPSEFIPFSAIDENHEAFGGVILPPTTTSDDTLRLRVRCQYGGGMDPCGIYSGEVEDYAIVVAGVNSVPKLPGLSFTLYPNPGNGPWTIDLPKHASGTLQVYDLQGKRCYQQSFNGLKQLKLDVELPSGSYLVSIQTQEGKGERSLLIQ